MPGIHHRHTIRFKEYDYSQNGMYFITICTHNRECLFGEIIDGNLELNQFGKIAYREWINLPERFTNVELDEFVIMPNHLHGIITIQNQSSVGAGFPRPLNEYEQTNIHQKGRGNPAPTKIHLGQIVGFFKYQTTKQFNLLTNTEGQRLWQRNYYEHIIRNEYSLNQIRKYIKYNPNQGEHNE